MWGGFDPAPEAVPAPAPYPDGAYTMTPSQFDARVELWTARQADLDASLRRDRAFVRLTRQREIRAAGAAAFVALLPLTSVFSTLTALPAAPHVDPVGRALALRGACDRWAGAPVTGGDLAWDEKTFNAFRGVDAKAADVERLAPRVAAALLVVAAALALGLAHGARALAASAMRRAATSRNAKRRDATRVSSANETAPRDVPIPTAAPEAQARVSPRPKLPPPPPPPPPAPRRPGSLGPLTRPEVPGPDPRTLASDAKRSRGSAADPRRSVSDEGSSERRASPPRAPRSPPSALRRSPAMGRLRRAVSSRANARLREVNAAANEAPTPEVARRVKSTLDPGDVLAELRAKSPFLAEANREARAHARAIASLREALERLDGTASPACIEALRDRAEATLATVTDEPRVLRLLEFPEARLESLRAAAANAAALRTRRARAETLRRETEAASFPSVQDSAVERLFLDHAAALAALDACVAAADAVDASRGADERRFRDAGIAFDWRATGATREAAVAMCGARLRSALARCAAARERKTNRCFAGDGGRDGRSDDEVSSSLTRSSREACDAPERRGSRVSLLESSDAREGKENDAARSGFGQSLLAPGGGFEDGKKISGLPEGGGFVDALRARDANGAEAVPPRARARRAEAEASADPTPPLRRPLAKKKAFAPRLDSRRAVSDAALDLWVLRSACDLAYRAYAGCGGVDAATDAAAAAAEVEIAAFGEEAWREAEIVAARAAAAARVRSY